MSVRWSQTDELHGTKPAELQPLLADLNRLAIAAQASGRQMFLWGSL